MIGIPPAQDTKVRSTLQSLLSGIATADVDSVLEAVVGLASCMNASEMRDCLASDLNEIKRSLNTLSNLYSPAALTMTTTNLPDSVTKLAQVLAMSSDATHTVLSILDQEELLLNHGEQLLQKLENAGKAGFSREEIVSFVEQERTLLKESRLLMTKLLSTQEYQDLCGQSIAKVMHLNEAVGSAVATLLARFSVVSEQGSPQPPPDKIEQDQADTLLKELGL